MILSTKQLEILGMRRAMNPRSHTRLDGRSHGRVVVVDARADVVVSEAPGDAPLQGAAVSPADDQHTLWIRQRDQRDVHKHLVIDEQLHYRLFCTGTAHERPPSRVRLSCVVST